MKKVCVLLFALMLLVAPAVAEENIYSLENLKKYDIWELANLRNLCQMLIMESEQWQEVEVPQGVWWVGYQIPAGNWTIRCKLGNYAVFSWGDTLKDNEHEIAHTDKSDLVMIVNPESHVYEPGDLTEYTVRLYADTYVVIEDSSVVFSPYAGQPDLGFK